MKPTAGPSRCNSCAPEFGCWDGSEKCQKAPIVGAINSEWPARDVVLKLVEAADLLLDHCDYDGDGWEQIHLARSLAHSWAESPNQSPTALEAIGPVPPAHKCKPEIATPAAGNPSQNPDYPTPV